MLGKIIITIGLAAAGLLLIIINTTTPSSVGASGMLLVFVLGYVVLLSLFSCLIWLASRLAARFGLARRAKSTTGRGLDFRKAYYYATVIALGPVILLGLQSVGGIGLREVSLVVILLSLGCLYVNRRAA